MDKSTKVYETINVDQKTKKRFIEEKHYKSTASKFINFLLDLNIKYQKEELKELEEDNGDYY